MFSLFVGYFYRKDPALIKHIILKELRFIKFYYV